MAHSFFRPSPIEPSLRSLPSSKHPSDHSFDLGQRIPHLLPPSELARSLPSSGNSTPPPTILPPPTSLDVPALSTLASVASAPASQSRYVSVVSIQHAPDCGDDGTIRLISPWVEHPDRALDQCLKKSKSGSLCSSDAVYHSERYVLTIARSLAMSYATSSPAATTGGQGNTPVSIERFLSSLQFVDAICQGRYQEVAQSRNQGFSGFRYQHSIRLGAKTAPFAGRKSLLIAPQFPSLPDLIIHSPYRSRLSVSQPQRCSLPSALVDPCTSLQCLRFPDHGVDLD